MSMRPGHVWLAVISLAAVVATAGPLQGQGRRASRASSGPTTAPAMPAGPSEQEIREAVTRGVNYLYSQHRPSGVFPSAVSQLYPGGGEALVAYALLQAGESPNEPRVKKTIEYLRGLATGHTYTRSLRVAVLAMLCEESRAKLAEDVQWLIREQQQTGGWGYGPNSPMTAITPDVTDGSNSQLAILALRDASDAGLPIPPERWASAENYWRSFQNGDGGWGYQPQIKGLTRQRPTSYGSMTAAGLASYYVFADKLGLRRTGQLAFADQINRGCDWLNGSYAALPIPKYVWMEQPGYRYYYHWLLMRVAEDGGLGALGGKDFIADVAGTLLAQQKPGGEWNALPDSTAAQAVIDTAMAVIALAKAQAPVVVARLELEPEGGRNPRAAANLARWVGRSLHRSAAWLKVDERGLPTLTESRLLLVEQPTAEQMNKLALPLTDYIRGGGTIVIQATPGDAQWADALADALAKPLGLKRQPLPADHWIWQLHANVPSERRPAGIILADGCRTRAFIFTDDVTTAWHQGFFAAQPLLFNVGANLAFYATGGENPQGRVAAREQYQPARFAAPKRKVGVARLRHAGDFDACPLAVQRLGETLAHSLPLGLDELPPVDAGGLIPRNVTLLWLTGCEPPRFTAPEVENIRKYLAGGGTLLIEPATGKPAFAAAGRELLASLAGGQTPALLPKTHALITGQIAGGAGADLTMARLRLLEAANGSSRPAATAVSGPALTVPHGLPASAWHTIRVGPPELRGLEINGRLAAIASDYGLSCAIEGTPCVESSGYLPDDARKLALNLLLYTLAGGK